MSHKTVAIVPAHNEEAVIRHTLDSLLAQTRHVKVIVTCDNCTDDTAGVAFASFPRSCVGSFFVMETVNNAAFKSGALNQALRQLSDNVDYVLILDADTWAAPGLVAKMVALLEDDPALGAACARTHVMPHENPGLFEAVWLRLQRLEYATADSRRVERPGDIQILAGSCVLYRWSALRQVAEIRGDNEYYDEGSLIEDYEITLALKRLGWKVALCTEAHSWTCVPTSMNVHWQQRLRWARSHVDTLRGLGWNETTRRDILEHVGFVMLLLQQIFFLGLLCYLLLTGTAVRWNPLLWPLLGLFWFNRMRRLRYLPNLTIVDILVRAAYFPEEAYGLLHCVHRVCAYWLAFTNAEEKWCAT